MLVFPYRFSLEVTQSLGSDEEELLGTYMYLMSFLTSLMSIYQAHASFVACINLFGNSNTCV